VDVTLAVGKLPQKSCSNVNASASAVPKRVSCESKNTIYLSGAASSQNVFFRCQISCANKEQVEASKNIRAMFIA